MRLRLMPHQKVLLNIFLLSAVVFFNCHDSKAQNNNASQPTSGAANPASQPATPAALPPSGQPPAVKPEANSAETAPSVVKEVTGTLALYNSIVVVTDNLSGLLKKADDDLSKIILHLNGYPLKGLPVRRVSTEGEDANKLVYDLRRAEDNDSDMSEADIEQQQNSWSALLGSPDIFPAPKKKYVRVSVGLENNPVQTDVTSYPMTVIKPTAFWFYVFALLGVAIALYYLAVKSDLLRDPGPDPEVKDESGDVEIKRKPYSLARTQMAMWFFVILASFIFIWLVSTSVTSLSGTVLGLMGISAGTALGAALIDSNKRGSIDRQKEELAKRRKSLLAEKAALEAKIPAAQTAEELKNLQASQASNNSLLDQVESELAKLYEYTKPLTSEGFIMDILSDDNGVSFHRFQIFVWTLALIVIFVASVYHVLSMPDFDGTLLALMGISSGTYLGFKVPEPRTPPEDKPAAATPGSPESQPPPST